jgi:hypothetical protein
VNEKQDVQRFLLFYCLLFCYFMGTAKRRLNLNLFYCWRFTVGGEFAFQIMYSRSVYLRSMSSGFIY